MTLDPSESWNNQGKLRVDVLDAADLPAADRNGYSDPYCKFKLDGKEVFKTKTQKKTLHPAWNEFFEVPVRSRTGADFEVTVYDWDFGDKADLLGKAHINLNILEPFVPQTVDLGLDGKSGTIRLKMLFKPDYVMRSRQGSSTFSGTFAVPGKVIGAPVKGVGKGAVLVGGGVVKGASFLGRGFKRRKSLKGGEEGELERVQTPDGSINGDVPVISVEKTNDSTLTTPVNHNRHRSWGAQSISSHMGKPSGEGEHGTASISIVSATEYPTGTNVRVHVRMEGSRGSKEVYKTKHIKATSDTVTFPNDTFKVPCTADTPFKLIVKDHSTFGSDEELGEGQFFIDDQGTGGEKTVVVGNGMVVVRSSFTPAESSGSPQSPKLRKGLLSRGRERSITPNTQ